MPRVVFTSNLQRHLSCPETRVAADTVRSALQQVFDAQPQAHAYDLVYRHGLDVDETGDRLAFGSTTGGLWLSEDQGDAWRCLSTQLPPIHCVRFG